MTKDFKSEQVSKTFIIVNADGCNGITWVLPRNKVYLDEKDFPFKLTVPF
jgi:hypothetical protein